jgi:diacylglycerol kinase family enzyme
VTARGRVIIQKALSADHDVTLAETTRRGNATRLAQSAAATGTELVVVLGGDGTLNEAANGLAGTDCALATLPGGSTNVFARTLGLPNDPVESAAVLLDALERDRIRSVGLGSVNGRYFLFHTGVGFDAATVRPVEKRSALKRYAGHPLFVWAAVTTWLRHYDRSKPRFAVHLPDGSVVDDGYFTLVMNTDPYTFLGNRPLHVTDAAGLDQPLAALTLRSLGLGTLLGVAVNALSGRSVASGRKVDLRTGLDGLRITGFGSVPYQVDGDYLGEASELTFKHEPDALRLLVP